MSTGMSKRDADAEATRSLIRETALRLFVERGFSVVSAEELVRTAGLTRGALYHHFEGKPGLFRELLVSLQEGAAERIGAAMAAVPDSWERALAGAREFLAICAEPTYREIVLVQGPVALGWHAWRELDQQHLGGLVLDGVTALQDEGLMVRVQPELVAAALYGALTELSLAVASAADPGQELDRAAELFGAVLEGLRAR